MDMVNLNHEKSETINSRAHSSDEYVLNAVMSYD